jgi:ectoine hydroxylase-related dioxygenase (phytanoyl-CoA dioxygenase family)
MSICPTIDAGGQPGSERPEAAQEAAELFMEHGCVRVKNAFDADYIARLHRAYVATYHPYFQDREFSDALNVGNKRTQVTVAIEGLFNSPQLYANDFVLPVLKLVLGDQLIMGGFGSVVSLPGALDQHTHRDHPNIYELTETEATEAWVDMLLPPYALNLIVPLVPLNDTNGTTRLWLGSHLVAKSRTQQMPSVDPVADLGDCLLVDYRLLHAGTANRSASPRPILYNMYCRPWFRDSRNYRKQQRIRISREEYMRIPAQFRHLFDWRQR